MPFQFAPLEIPGVLLVTPEVHSDVRGAFSETYKRSDFLAAGIDGDLVQESRATSVCKGTLRGLHYQIPPAAQGKLVSVLEGSIFDVVVDIRSGSPTFGRWLGVTLAAPELRMLWIPPGFAHGYCTLSESCQLLYKFTQEYSPTHERAIRWDDPDLAISWPTNYPLLSWKDSHAPALRHAELPADWNDP